MWQMIYRNIDIGSLFYGGFPLWYKGIEEFFIEKGKERNYIFLRLEIRI